MVDNKQFSINCPVNTLSLGFCSVALLRSIFNKGLYPVIFPIGNTDVSTQEIDQNFGRYLQEAVGASQIVHNRDNPNLTIWHLNGSLISPSKRNYLLTFHEVDSLTQAEQNIIRNQEHVFVPSTFSKEVFESYGFNNISKIDLGFDHANFYNTYKQYYDDDRIVFGLFGKAEPVRKAHIKTAHAWFKKFGNNPKYYLHAAVHNPFYSKEEMENFYRELTMDGKFWNVVLLPQVKSNREYNDITNSCDIVLAMSRGESRDLPCFHGVGLGKHCIGLAAHSYKDYLTEENAVLVQPNGKIKAEDGKFFKEGSQFNNGNFFDWNEDEFCDKLDIILERYNKDQINRKGLELQNVTYDDTVNQILEKIN